MKPKNNETKKMIFEKLKSVCKKIEEQFKVLQVATEEANKIAKQFGYTVDKKIGKLLKK